jgi:hypothetical protein
MRRMLRHPPAAPPNTLLTRSPSSLLLVAPLISALSLSLLLLGCGDDGNQGGTTTGDPPRPPAELLVAGSRGDDVLVVRQDTGEITKTLIAAGAGGLSHPDGMVFGPDGALYVASGDDEASSAVLRFDAVTGAPIGKFASGGGLQRPYGLAFGPDEMLYVASFKTDTILRYDAKTGVFVDVFGTGNGLAGGLNGPNGLLFGADGKLYVTTEGTVAGAYPDPALPSQVLRYDITTKAGEAFVATVTPSPSGPGYVSLLGVALGPDCNAGICDLFVSDYANDVRQYDYATGALKKTLSTNYGGATPSTNLVGGIAFGEGGRLFVAAFNSDEASGHPGAILRFDGATGDPLPSEGNGGALLVKEDARLKRPIGVATRPTTD